MTAFDEVADVFGDDMAVDHARQLVGERGEWLERIVQRLRDSGFDGQVQSWISAAPNEPISGDDVKRVFPAEVEHIAASAGLTADEAADEIAAVLPEIVDRLTPGGVLSTAIDETLSPAPI